MMRSILTRLAAPLAAATFVLAGCGAPSDTAAPPKSSPELIARGRYLAHAADCAACHTAPHGAPFAGGVKLESQFGTFYGTNITPDPKHGIGGWSADDFYGALHDGVTPKHKLYPAMPYTSYRQMSREDSDAIYAYLMTQKPAAVPNVEADLAFPYNVRFAVRFWDMLFLKDTLPDASSGQSADWTRGRYLANALGHCAECHTPRGAFGQMQGARTFQGGALGRIGAPDIVPSALAARGWTGADLQAFFATGIARQGTAFGEMHPVVYLSTQHLDTEDLRALATYLLGDAPPEPAPLAAMKLDDPARLATGRNLYLDSCAGCHGIGGQGKPHVAVGMDGNSTLRQADPRNLIVAMLDGIDAQRFSGVENMQHMPGFGQTYSDEQIAQLANYLRATWGGQPGDVTADKVKSLR
ncbi:gluconate 2-dehydrogenase (acceptor) [Caballeronia fortuita]|uniref:Gluconate 2-dehydrogenase (Acceptor) n=1 Tax=Caballeronia fortuita TaxID=1777138 RepID=A0A158E930_9BURK|nr:cytochrome c [Caballeronia fortuita]SAL03379.1 gluconate 2-dehydrogenase (acceptor) [Caballeronia fortuita]